MSTFQEGQGVLLAITQVRASTYDVSDMHTDTESGDIHMTRHFENLG